MKKLIRIEFALKNPQEVIIYGYDEELNKKEIGCIFTPAGSGEYIINAIQVCGFREAYDYWGCARYKIPVTNDEREKICIGLEGKKTPLIAAKDIQLLFDVETVPRDMLSDRHLDFTEGCCRCYNTPCTCDNKVDFAPTKITQSKFQNQVEQKKANKSTKNPYNLKREDDVPILKKTEDLECDYTYLDGVLIKKPKEENENKNRGHNL